jgi:hypothetical protein
MNPPSPRLLLAIPALTILAPLSLAAPPAKPPLAGLPSEPGLHMAKLRGLGDDEWLNLGPPAPDPKWGRARGRAYTPKMAYAPDLHGAFLYGEGVHGFWDRKSGKYMDDLWFYDVPAHRWVCVRPGTDVKGPVIKADAKGTEVDARGEPVPVAPMVHGYEMTTYDTDLQAFMFLPCPGAYWRKPIGERRQLFLDGKRDPIQPRSWPWFYHVATGKWQRQEARAPADMRIGFCGSLIYLPTVKKTFFYMRKKTVWLYDHEKSVWQAHTPAGPAPSAVDYEGLSCYDSKRDRVYLCNDKEEVIPHAYDVKTGKWVAPRPKTQPATRETRILRSASGALTYDSVNDVVLFFQFRARGGAEPGYYVYEPADNKWTGRRPLPRGYSRGVTNAFYDPKSNAHFLHVAGDSRDNGVVWAYRYRKARK